ncbi:MAG: Holliday junction branch migration protein RuvA [Cytophagales bacterium]|nr:Holliday junction branch migration protein RuvA [Cytophagales bacterium]
MFAFIEGKLEHKDPSAVVINTGGIGYQIFISLQTYSAIKDKEECRLFTYFHVREDVQALYGFADPMEKLTFTHLISVSGVGANTALVILSTLNPLELKTAIVTEDVRTIQSVKGIGAKTAQRIILDLKDKVQKEGINIEESQNTSAGINNSAKEEALLALTTLGIPKATAEKSIARVLRKEGANISVEELIKQALKTA